MNHLRFQSVLGASFTSVWDAGAGSCLNNSYKRRKTQFRDSDGVRGKKRGRGRRKDRYMSDGLGEKGLDCSESENRSMTRIQGHLAYSGSAKATQRNGAFYSLKTVSYLRAAGLLVWSVQIICHHRGPACGNSEKKKNTSVVFKQTLGH